MNSLMTGPQTSCRVHVLLRQDSWRCHGSCQSHSYSNDLMASCVCFRVSRSSPDLGINRSVKRRTLTTIVKAELNDLRSCVYVSVDGSHNASNARSSDCDSIIKTAKKDSLKLVKVCVCVRACVRACFVHCN
jgi:hypothetical protein